MVQAPDCSRGRFICNKHFYVFSGEKKKTTKKSKAARALKKNEGDDKDKSPRKKKKRIVKVDDLNSKTDSDNSRSSNPVPSEGI